MKANGWRGIIETEVLYFKTVKFEVRRKKGTVRAMRKKRLLALLLACTTAFTTMPVEVFAETIDSSQVISTQETTDEAVEDTETVEQVIAPEDEKQSESKEEEVEEVAKNRKTVVQTQETGEEAVLEGTLDYNAHTYSLYQNLMTWDEAKQYCEDLGGHLATITSEEEQEAIAGLLDNASQNCYWLGAADADSEGNWKWVT